MSITNLEDRLAAMQSAFDDAPTNSGGGLYELPPDGTYQALVHRFEFVESEKLGQAFLKTELQIANHPEYAGRIASTMHNLEDPDRIGWLKGHLAVLGVNVENLDLREVRPGSPVLQAVLDTPVEIAIKTSTKTDKDGNFYKNVYCNRALGGPLSDTPRSDVPSDTSGFKSEAAANDERIPF